VLAAKALRMLNNPSSAALHDAAAAGAVLGVRNKAHCRGAAAGATFLLVLLGFALPAHSQDINCQLAGGVIGNCVAVTDLPPKSVLIGVGTGSTGAVTATLTSSAAHLAYLCSFDVSAIGTASTIGPVTVTGLGSTMTFQLAATASGNVFTRNFSPCLPASGTNVNIVITTTADASASAVDLNAVGFLQ
jgi:hypothetical protein